jgi:hypothetical protein
LRYVVGDRDPIAAALRAGELPNPDVQGDARAVAQVAKRAVETAGPVSSASAGAAADVAHPRHPADTDDPADPPA